MISKVILNLGGCTANKPSENRKTLPNEHLIACQGVKKCLLTDSFKVFIFINVDLSYFKFCHNLSFWVLSLFWAFVAFLSFWVFFLQNLSFVPIWVFSQLYFCHNLSFVTTWILSLYAFLNFVTLSVFEFCHNLSFVTIWVFELHHNLGFCNFVIIWVFFIFITRSYFFRSITIWVFEFCHNLSFWVWSQFDFQLCHNLSLQLLSQFEV